MSSSRDTIVGLATPVGRGAVAILRVSGPGTRDLCAPLVGAWPQARQATLRTLRDVRGEILDQVLLLWFPAPRSFTGEDMLELHTHGGEVVPTRVMRALLDQGVRLAEPGEFSRRALLEGKQSLDSLEAIQELVASEDEALAASSLFQVQGGLRRHIEGIRRSLIDLAALFEANLDHPEEDLPELDTAELLANLEAIRGSVEQLAGSYQRSRLLRQGIRVALLGKPNVGKSSLLNALLKEERAIVTSEAGTTRDVLEEVFFYRGLRFRLQDTAGLRETSSEAEAIGVERAHRVVEQAEIRILVTQAGDRFDLDRLCQELRLEEEVHLVVRNKVDLLPETGKASRNAAGIPEISTSATEAMGISELTEAIYQLGSSRAFRLGQQELLVTNLRHKEALDLAEASLGSCRDALREGLPWDIAVVDLYQGIEALGAITGKVITEDVLDRIFERFCLGK